MRVAVHFAEDHPLAQDDGPAVVAYRLGRIEDGVHNAPAGHDPVALDEFLARLTRQARDEYPNHLVTQDESVGNRISIEVLVDNGDGTSRWINADHFDPEQHTRAGAGRQVQRDVSASAEGAG